MLPKTIEQSGTMTMVARRRLLIVGAGGHGRAVAEAADLGNEFEVAGFVDDGIQPGRRVGNSTVLGPIAVLASWRSHADIAIVAIGSNALREELHRRVAAAGFALATVRHPAAWVSPSAIVGPGCAVMAGAVIGTEARLGQGAIVNCGAAVDHHCTVEDFGHLGTGACMAGGSILGRGAWMQAGSALGYRVAVAPGEVLQPGRSLEQH